MGELLVYQRVYCFGLPSPGKLLLSHHGGEQGSIQLLGEMNRPESIEQKHTEVHMCHGQGCRVFLGMGDLPPLMTESL